MEMAAAEMLYSVKKEEVEEGRDPEGNRHENEAGTCNPPSCGSGTFMLLKYGLNVNCVGSKSDV